MGSEDTVTGSRKASRRDELTGLRYVGNGATLPDVPPRDLEVADINSIADRWQHDPGVARRALIDSGLYKE
jgi:hypothetical protein